jgi:lipoprotein-releasing system ATP-binding protein
VGPSGAGKSTFLHILGTLDRGDEGKIFYEGQDVFLLTEKRLGLFRNQHIGFVFQFHHLLPEFTALENVSMPAFIAKKNGRQVKEKAVELLSYLGLQDRLDHKPSELSGGEQQRVAVARALINDPKVILADEPSGNLDSDSARDLHQLFFKLREKFRQTFVIVTHNQELADLADRKLTMKDGVIST